MNDSQTNTIELPDLTIDQAAQLLGRSTRQVNTYLSQPDDPLPAQRGERRKRTLIKLPDLFSWALRRQLAELVEVPGGEVLDPVAERAQLDRARRRLAEQEFQRRSGELIETEEVVRIYGGLVIAFRARCLAIPDKIAQLLVGETDAVRISVEIEAAVRDALEELSEWSPPPPDAGTTGATQ